MIKTELEKTGTDVQIEVSRHLYKNAMNITIYFYDIDIDSKREYKKMITADWFNNTLNINIIDDLVEVTFAAKYYKTGRIKRTVVYILRYTDIYLHGVMNGNSIALAIENDIKEIVDDTE